MYMYILYMHMYAGEERMKGRALFWYIHLYIYNK